MNRRADTARIAGVAALLVCATLLTACSSTVARRHHGYVVGNASQSWYAVLPGAGVTEARLAGAAHALPDAAYPEYSRRDAALGTLREPRTDRPSLRDQRRLYIPRGRDQFIYFQRPRR